MARGPRRSADLADAPTHDADSRIATARAAVDEGLALAAALLDDVASARAALQTAREFAFESSPSRARDRLAVFASPSPLRDNLARALHALNESADRGTVLH